VAETRDVGDLRVTFDDRVLLWTDAEPPPGWVDTVSFPRDGLEALVLLLEREGGLTPRGDLEQRFEACLVALAVPGGRAVDIIANRCREAGVAHEQRAEREWPLARLSDGTYRLRLRLEVRTVEPYGQFIGLGFDDRYHRDAEVHSVRLAELPAAPVVAAFEAEPVEEFSSVETRIATGFAILVHKSVLDPAAGPRLNRDRVAELFRAIEGAEVTTTRSGE
jgi:hypothetical protein